MNQRTIFLFRKYIKNECTTEELYELLDALKDSKSNSQLHLITRTLWQAINQQPNKMPTETERKLLQAEVNKLLNQAQSTKVRYPFFMKSVYTCIMSVAAVAAVLVLIGVGTIHFTRLGNNTPDNTVLAISDFKYFNTDDNATRQISLPDGSHIHLNKNTELRIVANQFNHKLREVWLEGEAFFEVAKNPEKPFIIHTGAMQTKVLGTSFNVKAYPGLSEQVVSVCTGKVKVAKADGQFIQITPDQRAVFNRKTNALIAGVADGKFAASWRNGDIVFDHADRDEIGLRIRQEFGKKVLIQNNVLSNIHFIASYPSQTNLERIVKTIALTNGVQYSINENQVIFR